MRGLVAFDKNDFHMFEKLLRKFNSVIDEKNIFNDYLCNCTVINKGCFSWFVRLRLLYDETNINCNNFTLPICLHV